MKISLDWISEFVDLDGIAPERIADELTCRTAEVEGWEILRRSVLGVVVAEVLRAEPIADGTRRAVTVDVGGRRYDTVCGAPNVRKGMKAAFAPVGTTLAGDVLVETATLYGHPSEGVLCSAAELGMGTAHEGLLEVPADVPNGTPLADLVPAEDMIVEIDNKSLTHRPDLWGHYGFARELASIFGRTLRPFDVAELSAFDALPAYPVSVESAEDCPVYSALGLTVAHNPVSPLVVQRRLHALGSTPISALIDVTNYVQLELGQPTHAFDARNVGAIRVQRAGMPRTFTTLDAKAWKLVPDDLLIMSGDEPVALAGIMGGHGSQILPDTRSILLESANFKGSRVRFCSVRLGLRTDSSLRFEKKLPPLFAKLASARIVRHLEQWGLAPTATTRWSSVGDLGERPRPIELPANYLSKRSGITISNATARSILESIGFVCQEEADGGMTVLAPPFRSTHDIAIPEDISEEVMRLYGYDRITPTLPVAPLTSTPPHAATRNQHRMRRVLSQGHRFVEVQTYCWYSDDWLDTIGYAPLATLNVRNPIVTSRSRMRDTLVPNLLSAVHQNRRIRENFRIFELGRTFWMEGADKHEADDLAGVSVDQARSTTPEEHLRLVRGAVDDLVAASGLAPLQYVVPTGAEVLPWLAPGLTLSLVREGEVVGHIGLVPKALAAKVLDAGHAVWFSLRLDRMAAEVYPNFRVAPIPAFPGSWQDFTFVFPWTRGYAELSAILDGYTHPLLESRSLIAAYHPKGSETANYSFRVSLRRADGTMSGDDIEGFRASFLAFLAESGLKLV